MSAPGQNPQDTKRKSFPLLTNGSGGKCILQLRGVRPFFSDKYDITKHPKYRYLSDYDKKNAFDVERYMKRRPAIVKPEEPFDCYEISETDLQEGTGNEETYQEENRQ